jgi:hypothetical protein
MLVLSLPDTSRTYEPFLSPTPLCRHSSPWSRNDYPSHEFKETLSTIRWEVDGYDSLQFPPIAIEVLSDGQKLVRPLHATKKRYLNELSVMDTYDVIKRHFGYTITSDDVKKVRAYFKEVDELKCTMNVRQRTP